MPNINIREIDLTEPGRSAYANFSVVVPGFMGTPSSPDATDWDENGVCEVSSQLAFKQKIGLVGKHGGTAAIAPKLEIVKVKENEGELPTLLYWSQLTAEEFNAILDKGDRKIYAPTEHIGKKQNDWSNGCLKTLTLQNAKEEIYQYVEYRKIEQNQWDKDALYATIKIGNEGVDASENDVICGHMGNQFAYYLTTLGYTVLFKKFQKYKYEVPDPEDPEKTKILETYGDARDLLDYKNFWNPLTDRALYDFRYVVSGLIDDIKVGDNDVKLLDVNKLLVQLCDRVNTQPLHESGRGDCFALCDIAKSNYTANNYQKKGKALIEGLLEGISGIKSSYGASFAPTVYYDINVEPEYNGNEEFPASFHYLQCAQKAFEKYPEWFAVAGYDRGWSDVYTIKNVSARIGDLALNALQKRDCVSHGGINAITQVNGIYYIWGNRTLAPSTPNGYSAELTARNFLNIRQLCTTIKKQLYINCRELTFNPNSDELWINFVDKIVPLLEKMKSNEGIKNYKIVPVETTLKATLKAAIRIVPIEAVEDFNIMLTLEDNLEGATIEFDDEM